MQLEGKNSVYEAIRAKKTIDKLFIQKDSKLDREVFKLDKNLIKKTHIVSKNRLDEISISKHHQGIIAISDDFKYCELDDILNIAEERKEKPFILILDGIQDPHNLGSIIRVAECFGIHGIIIPKNRSAQITETVSRVSAGAINHILICQVGNLNYTIDKLKEHFINIITADMDGESAFNAHIDGPIALIIGNEGSGVHSLTKKKSDKIISLPMSGKLNSLNASVACGALCYEIVRQRSIKK